MIANVVSAIGGLISFIGIIIIAKDAFEDEIWKGILCVLCGLYALYYLFTDYYENRWLPGGFLLAGFVMSAVAAVIEVSTPTPAI